MKILIVEDEALLAGTLKQLVELNPLYEVTAIAQDLAEAMAAVEANAPELALVDLQLANGSSGFSVAARLHERGIACLFTTGNAPGFPLPDLALGCLTKPFETDDLARALKEAEDILRGRQKVILRARLPEQLQLYTQSAQPAGDQEEWVPGVRRRTSLWARIRRLVRRPSSFRSATAA
ncbi:MAG: two-component system, response regulator PdtaR [Sphingomonadales bacterium]|jgi:CheY-like chemotaxis protein|nr:two-component system, response regulator PdtaR [Sphingomonadales bacterium]